MNFRAWKIGLAIAFFFGLLTAGAGLLADMSWKAFVAVLCASLLTQLTGYLMKHPVESIREFRDDSVPLSQPRDRTEPAAPPEQKL